MRAALHFFVSSLLLAHAAHAIQAVSKAGRYLYTADGNRFYIKGIAYQTAGTIGAQNANAPFEEPTSFTDPLSDASGCGRDLPFLQNLTVNTVRVYSVNSSLNHDSCMQALSGAGIYTIIDLSLPVNGSLDRASPAWTTNLLDLYIETIDAFSKYDNVLAYNVGNEVVTSANETDVAPFIKAAARDVKAYLKSKNLNQLVGYAAIDADRTWLDPLASFLACDSDALSLDLFGLNNYEWCGDSSFQSAYSDVEGAFAGYNIPAYFSEFGCITSPPRLWTEVGALFSSQMSDVWSGGIAFSYFPAESGQGEFGMVTISSDGSTVTTSDDYDRLATQYQAVSAPNTPSQSAAGTTQFPTCPSQNSSFFASTTLPPTPNDTACACVVNDLSCRFTPATNNFTDIVGDLLDEACSLLGQQGGSCDDIAGNGQTGVYGRFSFCDPSSKLSFAMTNFYELTSRNAQSCSFAGNATINKAAPASETALNAAVSQCLAGSAATFTPTTPATTAGSGSSGSSSSSSTSHPVTGNSAVSFRLNEGVLGVAAMVAIMLFTGYVTLA